VDRYRGAERGNDGARRLREQDFREWLEAQDYDPNTVGAQIARVQRLEKAYGSLDEIDAAGLVQLRETLAYTTEDERRGKPNPAAFEIKGSFYKGLASYRATINYYLRFIGQGGDNDVNADLDPNLLSDPAIVARFDRSALFRNGRTNWTAEQTVAFCAIARAVHDAGLDWWLVDMARGPVRFGRKSAGRKHAEGVMGYVSVAPGWVSFNERGLAGLELDEFVIGPDGADLLAEALVEKADLIAAWKPPQPPRAGLWPDESGSEETDEQDSPTMHAPINLILYGPPGTGKTYHTAREAVRLCDGYDDYAEDEAGRQALMDRYRKLVAERRIDFVTFHQNFAYEEFVEGLRPDLGSGTDAVAGGFRLRAEPGIFAAIADRAAKPVSTGADRVTLSDRRIFKLSLGRADDPHSAWVFEESIEESYALLGFRDVDWSDARFATRDAILQELLALFPEERITFQMGDVKSPDRFRNQLAQGDVVVVSKGLNSFRAIGLVEGGYEYAPRDHGKYSHRRRVRWLWHDPEGVPVADISPEIRFSLDTIYELPRTRLNLPALQRLIDSGQAQDAGEGEVLPHVLIIDEINRGNISKVFGELITLIEPDKRLGMSNALTVRLPYSRREFGVPANLHIVGTMNTADRSIALLDTALRRRFRFKELAPRPDLLGAVDGIPLGKVLKTINQRLEYLLDRDHAIGHAFFMNEGGHSFTAIDDTMRYKIIPLLQEYFFEDWGRIQAVLGDGFITGMRLPAPPNTRETGNRFSWAVRSKQFKRTAWLKLAGVEASVEGVSTEDDNDADAE